MAEKRLRAEPRERQVDLELEDHPGEGAGEENDQERAIADVVDPAEERPELERRRDGGAQRLAEEGAEPAERVDDSDRKAADGLEWAQRRRDRPLRHARVGRFPGPRGG